MLTKCRWKNQTELRSQRFLWFIWIFFHNTAWRHTMYHIHLQKTHLLFQNWVPNIGGASYAWVGDYYNFNLTWYQKIKLKAWVRLMLRCDLYKGEHGRWKRDWKLYTDAGTWQWIAKNKRVCSGESFVPWCIRGIQIPGVAVWMPPLEQSWPVWMCKSFETEQIEATSLNRTSSNLFATFVLFQQRNYLLVYSDLLHNESLFWQ